jgi:release factor glutamine methyltransferase
MTFAMSGGEVTLPGLEADRIICFELGLSRASLMTHPDTGISDADFSRLIDLSRRRASGEPLAYILNDAIFCGRNFFVDNRVLIPRPETEILTGIADDLLKDIPSGVFADWCAGSGCICVTLLAQNSGCRAYAADISDDALEVVRINAMRHSVSDRLTFVQCPNPLEAEAIPPSSLDMIVVNPPYIPSREIGSLERQVRDYEPALALDGGNDGLDIFRLLLPDLPRLMKPGGLLLCETGGDTQAGETVRLAKDVSPELSFDSIFNDHRGICRYIMWRK